MFAVPVNKKTERKDRPIPVALKPEMIARLDALAEKIGENRSVVMRIAMRIGLDALERSTNETESLKLTPEMLNTARGERYPSQRTSAVELNEGPTHKKRVA